MKMESKISLTFGIMFVIAYVINGLYAISQGTSFFSLEVTRDAIIFALIYLLYIWVLTRRYKKLTIIGLLAIFILFLTAQIHTQGASNTFDIWNWQEIVNIIYCVTACAIAEIQVPKLLEESENKIEIIIEEVEVEEKE